MTKVEKPEKHFSEKGYEFKGSKEWKFLQEFRKHHKFNFDLSLVTNL